MAADSAGRRVLRVGLRGLNAVLKPCRLTLVHSPVLCVAERTRRILQDLNGVEIRFDRDAPRHAVAWLETWPQALRRLGQHRQVILWNRGETVYASVDGIAVELTSDEELLILCEVFHDGDYAYQQGGTTVVIDVGMNVGIASLYFASQPNIAQVYGYEPFPATCALAQRNFALNTVFRRKIVAHPFGLGSKDTSVTCRYSFARKGNMGPYSRSPFIEGAPDVKEQTVDIHRASPEIRRVKNTHPNESILLKLDAEGAEKAVMDDLLSDGSLGLVDAVVMEWHYEEPKAIAGVLSREGFGVQIRGCETASAWRVMAVRRGRVAEKVVHPRDSCVV